eukprot:TRINITY_DN6164_c0_g2_i1.p1 TRINITY_DN6164_c0_g2~~TRINITY_DN6164_c0_g2_i1.p1  ORF type:complete len:529 (-),score=201.44 TRINITY_DN6164_c0_g2_i1:302-1816(-)
MPQQHLQHPQHAQQPQQLAGPHNLLAMTGMSGMSHPLASHNNTTPLASHNSNLYTTTQSSHTNHYNNTKQHPAKRPKKSLSYYTEVSDIIQSMQQQQQQQQHSSSSSINNNNSNSAWHNNTHTSLLVSHLVTPHSASSPSHAAAVSSLLYSSGTHVRSAPSEETVLLVESIVLHYCADLVRGAIRHCHNRGMTRLSVNDVIFQLRHDTALLSRIRAYLRYMHEKKAPRASEAKKGIITQFGMLHDLAQIDEEEEEEYLTELDAEQRRLVEQHFSSKSRKLSFTHKKVKKFRAWLGTVLNYPINDEVTEILGFLAGEHVVLIIHAALQVQKLMEEGQYRGTGTRSGFSSILNLKLHAPIGPGSVFPTTLPASSTTTTTTTTTATTALTTPAPTTIAPTTSLTDNNNNNSNSNNNNNNSNNNTHSLALLTEIAAAASAAAAAAASNEGKAPAVSPVHVQEAMRLLKPPTVKAVAIAPSHIYRPPHQQTELSSPTQQPQQHLQQHPH